jgi:hypothetical protein
VNRGDPETNTRGEATFAELTRMQYGPVPGAWRARSTAENDPWYDVPAAPPAVPPPGEPGAAA